jgi:hypothetical protein
LAIGSSAQWEIRTTGNDNNAGFYTSGGTDYSQQDSPQLSVSDIVTVGSTTVTSVIGGFTAAMIGNGINIVGDGIYQITARASTNSITVDRNTGTATGQTGNVGGALASPAIAVGKWKAGNTIWIKSGTYLITTSSANVAGGVMTSITASTNSNPTTVRGYGSSRGDNGVPLIQASGISTCSLFQFNNVHGAIFNIKFDCASLSAVYAVFMNGGGTTARYFNCTFVNGSLEGPFGNNNTIYTDCFFSSMGVSVNACVRCVFNACGNVTLNNCELCIFCGNSDLSINFIALNNTIYSSSTSGILPVNNTTNMTAVMENNLICNCSGYGIVVNGRYNQYSDTNAFYSNSSGNTDAPASVSVNNISLSGSPFVNPTATINSIADALAAFALNATANAGTLCRGTGRNAYLDIGAVQHQDSPSPLIVRRQIVR